MATIVNAIDALLQPVSPRVSTTTIPTNLQVQSINFTGTIGGQNLCANGGFEVSQDNGTTPYGWSVYAPYISATLTRTTGRTGSGYAAKATATGVATAGSSWGFGVNRAYANVSGWQPGKTYVVSWYAKRVGAGWGGSNMGLNWNTWPSTTRVVSNPPLTTSWQRYAFVITHGATPEPNGGIYITVSNPTLTQVGDELHIDDVQVEEGDVITSWSPCVLDNQERSFRVASWGSATGNPKPGSFAGLFDATTGVNLGPTSARSYMMARVNRATGSIDFTQTYDIFGAGATTAGRNAATLAADLNATSSSYVVVVWTYDEPRDLRLTSSLDAAMYRCGASRSVYGSANFAWRGAYILIGIAGCGEGNGAEAYQGDPAGVDANSWCEMTFGVLNGNLVNVSASFTPRTLIDYGYTGDTNATSDLTLVAGNGVKVTGNTITKMATTSVWDSGAFSKESYAGGAYCSGQVTAANTALMIGLNTDPATDDNYTSLDWAWYTQGDGKCFAFQSGTNVSGAGWTYATGDILTVSYDGSNVRWLQNGVIQKTVAVTITSPLFFDSSFNTPGASIKGVKFGPMTNNSWANVGGSAAVDARITAAAITDNLFTGSLGTYSSVNLGGAIAGTGITDPRGTTTAVNLSLPNTGSYVHYNVVPQGKSGPAGWYSVSLKVLLSVGYSFTVACTNTYNWSGSEAITVTTSSVGLTWVVVNVRMYLTANQGLDVVIGAQQDTLGNTIKSTSPGTYTVSDLRAVRDDTLGANVRNVLAGSGGITAGNITWDSNGNVSDGSGVAITSKGIVGRNAFGTNTFVIDATSGAASFGGTLTAPSGSLNRVYSPGYSSTWAWPVGGTSGYYLGPEGLLFGSPYAGGTYTPDANASWFQIGSNGNVYGPGFSIENGKYKITQVGAVGSSSLTGDAQQFSPYRTWEFNNTLDGWGLTAATYTLNATSVTLTATTSDPMFWITGLSIPGGVHTKVRARIKRLSGGAWDGLLFYATSGHGWDGGNYKGVADTTVLNQWVVVEWDMEYLSAGGADWINNTITGLRLDLGAAAGTVFEVDWVAIGKYSSGLQTGSAGGIKTVSLTTGQVDFTSVTGKTATTNTANFTYSGGALSISGRVVLSLQVSSPVSTAESVNYQYWITIDGSQTIDQVVGVQRLGYSGAGNRLVDICIPVAASYTPLSLAPGQHTVSVSVSASTSNTAGTVLTATGYIKGVANLVFFESLA